MTTEERGVSLLISDNPADDAAAWMHNRLDGSIHPALNTDNPHITYDNDRQVFTLLTDEKTPDLRAIYKEAESKKRAFIATVERYNADARRHGMVVMDIRAEHTWEEVLSVERGFFEQRQEAEKSNGFKSFIHERIRRFGDNSESFQAWLKLLPAESQYLSVLCGGLKLLLGAAHRMAEIRESVRKIVDEIPRTLSGAKQYIEVFAESPELHKCNADLYVAIVNVLDAILQQYQKHVASRISSALFRQSMSGKELQDKIESIKIYTKRLATQANISSMQRQKIMLAGEKDMTKMIISSARNQDHGFNTIAFSQNDILQTLQSQDRTLQSHDRNLGLIAHVQLWNVQVLNQCLDLLKASPKPAAEILPTVQYLGPEFANEGHGNSRSRSPSPNAELDQQQYRQELNDLLIALNINQQADVAAKDTAIQVQLIHTLSLASQDRFVALITSPRLRDWLTGSSSSILHVNGHMFLNEYEARQSLLSYFCAKFVDGILAHRQHPQQGTSSSVIAICWFCGRHTDVRTDYDAHPPGMLNNLLSQLIHQISRSTLELRLIGYRMPEADPQLSELCNLFVQLAEALPMGTILFCIIDGISYYEDEERRAECIEVLSMLTRLTRNSQGSVDGPLIKLLITAPLRANYEREMLEVEEVLNMDEHYPSQGGFSALQWNVGIGRMIEQ